MNRPERRNLTLWIKVPLYLLALFIGSIIALYTFRVEIFSYAEKRLGVSVSAKEIRLLHKKYPGIELDGLAIESQTHQLRSFTADELRVLFEPVSWKKVFKGEVRIEEITIIKPDLLLVDLERKQEKKSEKINLPPADTSDRGKIFLPLAARNFLVKDGQFTMMSAAGDKRISCKFNISGQMERSLTPTPAELNGKITFSIRDGFIRELGFLGKFFQLINPEAYLRGEVPDLTKEGFIFNSFSGTLTIKNGVGTLERTLLKSAAWNILATGELDFAREEMDLDIYAQPLKTVDKIISWIPVIGEILKEKDRGVVDFHFKVTGKMDDPKVESKQASNLADKVLGIIKRGLNLPLKVLPDSEQPQKTD